MADKLVVTCETRDETTVPLTVEEQADKDAISTVAEQERQQDAAESTNESTINDRLDQALSAMQAHVSRGTFTAAQRDAAILLVLRVCIGVVRLLRRRLDAVD